MDVMNDCKRLFEMNNLHFPDEFYYLPDCIEVLPIKGTTATLVFVKPSNQLITKTAVQTPLTNNYQPFGLQEKSNTMANVEIPANPNTFQQIRMEEEPISQISDIQQTVMNPNEIIEFPQTRFTEIEKPQVDLGYKNPISGEKYIQNDKTQFQQLLTDTFAQTKLELTSPKPFISQPKQPSQLVSPKPPKISPKVSPKHSPMLHKGVSAFEVSPNAQKKYPKLAKQIQNPYKPSKLSRDDAHSPHSKLKAQASSPVLSPMKKPAIKEANSTAQIKPTQTIQTMTSKLDKINSTHNTTPIPSVKPVHSIRDDFAGLKQQKLQQQHSQASNLKSIIEEKKDQPSYPISDYYNSDEEARSRNRKIKQPLQMEWTKKGNLTPLVNRTNNEDPVRIFKMAPIVICDETDFVSEAIKQQQRRNRSMAWK